jgi:histone H3/H4
MGRHKERATRDRVADDEEEKREGVAAETSPQLAKAAGKGGRKPRRDAAGGQKRSRDPRSTKSLPDSILRRSILVYGPKRVGPKALGLVRDIVEAAVGEVVADATRSAALEGRKTIKGRDTRRALKARGIVLI